MPKGFNTDIIKCDITDLHSPYLITCANTHG